MGTWEHSFPETNIDELRPLHVTVAEQPVDVVFGTKNEDAVSGAAAVPTSTWTTVVSFTPVDAKLVTHFNADVGSITPQNFRVRLRVNGTVKITEVLSATQRGLMEFPIKVAAGVPVDVQVFHTELSSQNYEAAIAYRDV